MKRPLGPCGALWAALALAAASPASAQIVNGGFESGSLSGWTQSAFQDELGGPFAGTPSYATFLDAQAQPDAVSAGGAALSASSGAERLQTISNDLLAPAPGPVIAPIGGSYLGYVTNFVPDANGNPLITGSSLSQTFQVQPGDTALSFQLRLLTDELPDDFADFNDFGGLALTQNGVLLDQFTLALDPLSGADAAVDPALNVGGFRSGTPWLTHTFDVSGLAGQQVTLTAFTLHNGGDDQGETRLLLDRPAVAPVPEASTAVSLALGLSLLLLLSCRAVRRGKMVAKGSCPS